MITDAVRSIEGENGVAPMLLGLVAASRRLETTLAIRSAEPVEGADQLVLALLGCVSVNRTVERWLRDSISADGEGGPPRGEVLRSLLR